MKDAYTMVNNKTSFRNLRRQLGRSTFNRIELFYLPASA